VSIGVKPASGDQMKMQANFAGSRVFGLVKNIKKTYADTNIIALILPRLYVTLEKN
jgi:hypothetical protein